MLILNFTHPLTPAQLAQVEALLEEPVAEVRDVPTQFDNALPFIIQVQALADACELTSHEWQTTPLIIIPPAFNFIAMVLLAELHGRCGYFPTMMRMRPVPDCTPPRFEVAELVDLQAVRDSARERRQDEATS
jgi:hypothetical protein